MLKPLHQFKNAAGSNKQPLWIISLTFWAHLERPAQRLHGQDVLQVAGGRRAEIRDLEPLPKEAFLHENCTMFG